MAKIFTKHFSIKVKTSEFVDIPVDSEDLIAFICPFLIESNKNQTSYFKYQ
jgi:hypothetical protein